jgi:hypothetical protein
VVSSLSKVQVLHTGWDWHSGTGLSLIILELSSVSSNTVEALNDSDAEGLMSLGRRNMIPD